MKRYGNNLPASIHIEDEVDTPQSVQVMYGGCGVRFGTFTKTLTPPKKRKTFDLLALLGFKHRKNTPSVR